MTEPKDKWITVNGIQLHYVEWGESGIMPMICLHGHTGTCGMWREFAQAMQTCYRVLTPDQRGHGKSGWATTGYERDRFVEDLAAFVDLLNIERMVLVGASMGGWHALLYAHDRPERVEKIVLVDIGPEPSPASLAQRKHRPPTPMRFDSLDAVFEWARGGNSWAADSRLRKDVEERVRRLEDGTWSWCADPALFNVLLPDATDEGLIRRYWKAVESIPCPILEVRAGGNNLVSDDLLDRMKRAARHFEWTDVSHSGHVVPVDQPEAFIRATRSFLGVPT